MILKFEARGTWRRKRRSALSFVENPPAPPPSPQTPGLVRNQRTSKPTLGSETGGGGRNHDRHWDERLGSMLLEMWLRRAGDRTFHGVDYLLEVLVA